MKYILVIVSTVFLMSCNSIKGQSKQIDSVNVNIDYNEYIKKTKKQQVFKKDLVVNEDMAIKLANIY